MHSETNSEDKEKAESADSRETDTLRVSSEDHRPLRKQKAWSVILTQPHPF